MFRFRPLGAVLLAAGCFSALATDATAVPRAATRGPVSTPTLSVLYNFPKNKVDGQAPEAGLIADANGARYGTTSQGGTRGSGIVFVLK